MEGRVALRLAAELSALGSAPRAACRELLRFRPVGLHPHLAETLGLRWPPVHVAPRSDTPYHEPRYQGGNYGGATIQNLVGLAVAALGLPCLLFPSERHGLLLEELPLPPTECRRLHLMLTTDIRYRYSFEQMLAQNRQRLLVRVPFFPFYLHPCLPLLSQPSL